MQTELYIPENGRDHRVRLEEDLVPVEPQHDESEAGETGIPPKVPKTLLTAAVMLLAVALDYESIAHKKIHPVEIRERDAHLRYRRASHLRQKHPDHALRPRICAIVDKRKERTPLGGQADRSGLEVETRGLRAAEERIQNRDDIFFRFGIDELPDHFCDRSDTDRMA
jgi:hypothetical protein